MAAGGEGDGDKSAFRCLDAARYVAAAVVIVLIAAVVVNAIRVVLRPDDITLSVVGSSVITGRVPRPGQDHLSFRFALRAGNPSGRVQLYYYSITAYVFANDTMATTPTPDHDCTMLFNPADMSLPPMKFWEDSFFQEDVANDSEFIDPTFFDALYKNGSGGTVSGVTMRVEGQLVSEIRSGINTTAQNMTLYCRELVFGPEDKVAAMSSQATTCSTT